MPKVQKVKRSSLKTSLIFAALLAGMGGLTYTIYEMARLAQIDDAFDVEEDDDN